MAQLMSKSELIEKLAGHSDGLTKKNVRDVLEGLAAIAYKELKKSGAFLVPGLAKFVVVKKPATKAREGINPFTKEPTIFKAKPAQVDQGRARLPSWRNARGPLPRVQSRPYAYRGRGGC